MGYNYRNGMPDFHADSDEVADGTGSGSFDPNGFMSSYKSNITNQGFAAANKQAINGVKVDVEKKGIGLIKQGITAAAKYFGGS